MVLSASSKEQNAQLMAPLPPKTFWLLENLMSVCRFCAAERLSKHWTSVYSA